MLQQILLEFFKRDLLQLKEEIKLYPDEADLWALQPGISNSAGTLCLHLIGNLKHFVGAVLGETGYIRDRPSEFSLRDVPRENLISGIDETILVVNTTLERLADQDFEKTYPLKKGGQVVTTGHMLLHLLTHLNYHLGQVNYHRRLTGA